MLLSLTLSLKAREDFAVPPSFPVAINAIFLKMVQEIDPDMSIVLHDALTNKSYSLSSFYGARIESVNDGMCLFGADNTYQWRINSLNAELSNFILTKLAPNPPKTLNFLGGVWEIAGQNISTSNYSALYSKYIPVPYKQKKCSVEFLSPTTFKSQGINKPYPEPRLVYQSYMNRWNEYSDIDIGKDEFVEWVDKNVFVTKYNISTRYAYSGKARSVGFSGDVEFGVKPPKTEIDELNAKIVYMLSEYANYACTGSNTTYGMGQTKAVTFDRVKI